MKETDKLAAAIQKAIKSSDKASLLRAVVSAINTTEATVSVKLSGDSTAIPGVRHLQQYHPTLGDSVLVAKQRNSMVIVDKVASVSGTSGSEKADDAQAAADAAQDTANTAAASAHGHDNTIKVGVTTVSPSTTNTITSKTVSSLGLDSGTYYGFLTANSSVPGPSGMTRDDITNAANEGPGRDLSLSFDPAPTNSSITIQMYRSTQADTDVNYCVMQSGNPIT